jgi:hypothetical protein
MHFISNIYSLVEKGLTVEQALIEIMMSEEYQEYCLNKNIEEVEETVFKKIESSLFSFLE